VAVQVVLVLVQLQELVETAEPGLVLQLQDQQ
jgi:hypothetical protein